MSLTNITSENFEEEVMKSERPVLLDFWAGWCGPCQMLMPTVSEVAEQVKEKVGKVNVDEQPELARKYGVMSIPTLIVIRNGKVVNKAVGVKTKEEILSMLA